MLGMLQTGCGQKSETETPSGKEAEEDAGENEGTEGQYDALLSRGGEISGQSYISEFGFTLEFPGEWEPMDRKETAASLGYDSAEEEFMTDGRLVDAAFVNGDDAVIINYEVLDESQRGEGDITSYLGSFFEYTLPEEEIEILEAEFAGVRRKYIKETDQTGVPTYWLPYTDKEIMMNVIFKAWSGNNTFEDFLGYAYDTEKGKGETTAYEAYMTAVSLTGRKER